MGIEAKLDGNVESTGLEGKVNFSLKNAWQQMTFREKLTSGLFTAISALTVGPVITLSTLGVYVAVYKGLQKKAKQAITKKGLMAETVFSGLSSMYGVGMYKIFNMFPTFLSKMAFGFFGMIPLSYALYFPTKHLLHNYTMRQFIKQPATAISEGIDSMKQNFWNAYKKSLLYLPVPLGAFWYLTPPSLMPLMHVTLGGAARVFFKYTVDKDIKPVSAPAYSMPPRNYAYSKAA